MAARHDIYPQARQRNPARWSHIAVVTLNQVRDAVVNSAANVQHTQQQAA
jgi:hypothetical protein